MKLTQFNTFNEIDDRLKILKLQKEIDKEGIKLNWNRTKTSFHPTHIMGNFGGILPKLILSFFAGKLMKKFRS